MHKTFKQMLDYLQYIEDDNYGKINEAVKVTDEERDRIKTILKSRNYNVVVKDKNKNLFFVICPDKYENERLQCLKDVASIPELVQLNSKILPKQKSGWSSVGRIVLDDGISIEVKPSEKGSSGTKIHVNKGNYFEDVFHDALTARINGEIVADPKLERVFSQLENMFGGKITDCAHVGSQKVERPLVFKGKNVYSVSEKGVHPKVISDENIVINGKTVYLSLKSMSKVTLANIGIMKIIKESDVKSGYMKDSKAQTLLNAFGISNRKFCEVFNKYTFEKNPETGRTKRKSNTNARFVEITDSALKAFMDEVNIDAPADEVQKLPSASEIKRTLQGYIKSIIGTDFIFIHNKGSDIDVHNMYGANLDSLTKIRSAYIKYPEIGKAKRIDIFVECDGIDVDLNIRSKTGGVLPTHIMGDYKFK